MSVEAHLPLSASPRTASFDKLRLSCYQVRLRAPACAGAPRSRRLRGIDVARRVRSRLPGARLLRSSRRPVPGAGECPYHMVFETAPPPDAEVVSNFEDVPRPFIMEPPPAEPSRRVTSGDAPLARRGD